MQCVTFGDGNSFFKRAAKPEQFPIIVGVSSAQIEPLNLNLCYDP